MDAFICHASTDKEVFVNPLSAQLRMAGINVWLDEWCLEIGESLSQSISQGLIQSRFGIVVLSKEFFNRTWPQKELGALLAKESARAGVILPIWYDITEADVIEKAPLLAYRVAAKSQDGLENIITKLTRVIKTIDNSSISSDGLKKLTEKLFPNLGIDEFWQARMLADLDKKTFHSLDDIERAVLRAKEAVNLYAKENPKTFITGTDYITKSLGFVDLCFRHRHNWSYKTLETFQKYSNKVDWEK